TPRDRQTPLAARPPAREDPRAPPPSPPSRSHRDPRARSRSAEARYPSIKRPFPKPKAQGPKPRHALSQLDVDLRRLPQRVQIVLALLEDRLVGEPVAQLLLHLGGERPRRDGAPLG